MTNQSSGKNPRVNATIPTGHKQAIQHISMERSAPGDQTPDAQVVREAIELFLAAKKATGEVPAEALSNLEGIDAAEVLEEHDLTVRSGSIETEDGEEVTA